VLRDDLANRHKTFVRISVEISKMLIIVLLHFIKVYQSYDRYEVIVYGYQVSLDIVMVILLYFIV
jgi:hypothetical protein